MVGRATQPPALPRSRGWPKEGKPGGKWRLPVMVCALAVVFAGCTYSREEPGLFPPAVSSQTPTTTERPRLPPRKTNPVLPVAGQAIWTTAEGLRVTVRFGIHAIRRIEGATVLDWSVTPISAPGLRAGDQVPGWIDLGLTRQTKGDVNIVLIDATGRRVYRPLSHASRAQFNRCLCSPMFVSRLGLRIGETRLLQLTFPRLPQDVAFVDVSLANVATFWRVAVHPLGQAPMASKPTDLARAVDAMDPASEPRTFTYPAGEGRRLSIQIRRIVASPNSTSVEWTIHSITDQPGISLLAYGPPLSSLLPNGVFVAEPASASGLLIRPSTAERGPALKVQWITDRGLGRNFYECLCTSIGIWAASLRRAGGTASVNTNFPPLPADTAKADVTLPGITTLHGLPVVRARDAAAAPAQPGKHPVSYWVYDVEAPPNGWSTYDWPTPTPDPLQLRSYNSFVEEIVPLPGS
jgi:hypothetical protein